MSVFWFPFFGDESKSGTDDVTTDPALNPPQRDRSLSAQFFSFFADDDQAENAADCNEVAAINDSPVAKTLSEMAQSLSEMADETIRTFSPSPAVPPAQPGKLSYRRKTVFAPTGHLTEELEAPAPVVPPASSLLQVATDNTLLAPPEPDTLSTLEVPTETPVEIHHKYRSVKEGKDVPLLTALSRNRPSFKVRESTINQIANKTKQETPAEQFTVSNLTGAPSAAKFAPLASITEQDRQDTPEMQPLTADSLPSRADSLPSGGEPEEIYHYDSERYMVTAMGRVPSERVYTESDDDDIITADLDFEIFKPIPTFSSPDENIYFVNSNSSLNGDSEPLNLIGTYLPCCRNHLYQHAVFGSLVQLDQAELNRTSWCEFNWPTCLENGRLLPLQRPIWACLDAPLPIVVETSRANWVRMTENTALQ